MPPKQRHAVGAKAAPHCGSQMKQSWSLSQSQEPEARRRRRPTEKKEALQDRKKQFEKCGLQVIKVEEIGNGVLEAVFQAKKKMMEGNTRKEPLSRMLFQRVPRQFCDMVCRVGFHRVYSGPCDSKYGVGIYFTKNLKTVADQIHKTTATDELIYVFEAEVLTGSFCQGCHTNIVPSPLSPGVIDSHDSVVDSVSSPETFVIFSGTQAVPKYLWTCTQVQVQSQNYSPKQMTLSPWSPKRSSIGSSVDDPHIK
ncbi:protein mono-ADP-ribosyltransferase PARP9-like [Rhynchocyon petersi]